MKNIIVFGCLLLLSVAAISQEYPHDYSNICCQAGLEEGHVPNPAFEPISAPDGLSYPCGEVTIEDFAAFSLNELVDYLIAERNPYNCFYYTLFGYNSVSTPLVFDNAKVKYIAETLSGQAIYFDGINDNGVYSLISYLSLAVQHSIYRNDDVVFTSDTWTAIRNSAATLANNPNVLLETDLSILVISQLMNVASAQEVCSSTAIINLVSQLLLNLGNDSFESPDRDINLYSYYFSYYYVLDVYLRYAPDNPDYIAKIIDNQQLLTNLAIVATNRNINNNTYKFFGELSSHSVTALTRYIDYPELSSTVGSALTDVTTTYPQYSSNWVTASLGILRSDVESELDQAQIIQNLESLNFEHDHKFDNGKMIISTSLPYDRVLALYQAAQEVKAHFFRFMNGDQALANDDNDTLRVKIYSDRASYQDYNGVLYGVNYPNSGGVYIEAHGTFYTYDRTDAESAYSLESLFRHEYTHYLQGRYLVPGRWGGSPHYDDGRLVWFEEGMAQFMAGSTQSDGVKALSVIKTHLDRNDHNLNISDVVNSNYSTGNPDAYYIYGPMLWFKWLDSNSDVIQSLFNHARNGNIEDFDAIIDYYATNAAENEAFDTYITQKRNDHSFWLTPSTVVDDAWASTELSTLGDEIVAVDSDFIVDSVEVIIDAEPKQYKVTGTFSIGSFDGSEHEIFHAFDDKLNTLLATLADESALNLFDYSVGYFTDIENETTATARYSITGPLGEIIAPIVCDAIPDSGFSVEVYDNFAILIPAPEYVDKHQFRYKDKSSNAWVNLFVSDQSRDTINYLFSPNGYDFSLRQKCANDEWTPHSESKSFYMCPDERHIGNVALQFDATYSANEILTTSSIISADTEVTMRAGEVVEMKPGFEVIVGGVIHVQMEGCRNPE